MGFKNLSIFNSSTHVGTSDARAICLRFSLFIGVFAAIFAAFSFHFAAITTKNRLIYRKPFKAFVDSNPLVLFVGDSHPGMDIDPVALNGTFFSLAEGGTNLRQILLRIDFAVRKKPSIRFVVIPLDYHIFATPRYINKWFADDLYYTDNMSLIMELYDVSVLEYFKQRMAHHLPLTSGNNWEKYGLVVIGMLERTLFHHPRKMGAGNRASNLVVDLPIWSTLSERQRYSRAKRRVASHFDPSIVVPEMVCIFDRLLNYCRTHGLATIGVMYPITEDYIRAAAGYDLDKVSRIYEERRNQFLFILDYRQFYLDKPQLFLNSDHLSVEGVRVFTERIQEDIERKLFK